MAKKFFYVCAGVFLLVLTYQLGARSAVAQALGISAAVVESNGAVVVIGRQMTEMFYGNPAHTISEPIPGGSPVVACWYDTALLENGEVWQYADAWGGWGFRGSLGLGATPTVESSWGALKVKAR